MLIGTGFGLGDMLRVTGFGLSDTFKVTRFGPGDSLSGPSITSIYFVLVVLWLKEGSY